MNQEESVIYNSRKPMMGMKPDTSMENRGGSEDSMGSQIFLRVGWKQERD